MIWAFVKAYWKQLLIVAMLAALVIGGRVAWNVHGSHQYDAGYAQAKADPVSYTHLTLPTKLEV